MMNENHQNDDGVSSDEGQPMQVETSNIDPNATSNDLANEEVEATVAANDEFVAIQTKEVCDIAWKSCGLFMRSTEKANGKYRAKCNICQEIFPGRIYRLIRHIDNECTTVNPVIRDQYIKDLLLTGKDYGKRAGKVVTVHKRRFLGDDTSLLSPQSYPIASLPNPLSSSSSSGGYNGFLAPSAQVPNLMNNNNLHHNDNNNNHNNNNTMINTNAVAATSSALAAAIVSSMLMNHPSMLLPMIDPHHPFHHLLPLPHAIPVTTAAGTAITGAGIGMVISTLPLPLPASSSLPFLQPSTLTQPLSSSTATSSSSSSSSSSTTSFRNKRPRSILDSTAPSTAPNATAADLAASATTDTAAMICQPCYPSIHDSYTFLDLSYPLDASSAIFWPGSGEGFSLCMNCSYNSDHDYQYAAGTFDCAEHGGTHVDAPFHFSADGKTVDLLPLTDLIGNCRVIDIRGKYELGKRVHIEDRRREKKLAEEEQLATVVADQLVVASGDQAMATSTQLPPQQSRSAAKSAAQAAAKSSIDEDEAAEADYRHGDYGLTKDDLIAYEADYGPIQSKDILLIRTGWHRYYSSGIIAYLGYDAPREEKDYGLTTYDPEVSRLSFPGITPSAARYLVSKQIAGVGLDTASLDPGYAKDFLTHRILLSAGIYGIENINECIDLLPVDNKNGQVILQVLPMKIKGGSVAPARVVAWIPK